MPVNYNVNNKTTRTMTKFMRDSRKITGTNLNRQPRVKNDDMNDPKLNRSPKGLAHGRPVQDRLNDKPMSIRKKVSEAKVNKQQTKLTSSRKKATNNKRNKGMVRKYK
jgi:hypothetical protein